MKLGNPLKRLSAIFGRGSDKTAAPATQRFENVPVPADRPRRRPPNRREKFGNGLHRHLGGARKGWIA